MSVCCCWRNFVNDTKETEWNQQMHEVLTAYFVPLWTDISHADKIPHINYTWKCNIKWTIAKCSNHKSYFSFGFFPRTMCVCAGLGWGLYFITVAWPQCDNNAAKISACKAVYCIMVRRAKAKRKAFVFVGFFWLFVMREKNVLWFALVWFLVWAAKSRDT